ncbi:MAG: type II secretion system inner membrane protein GspF [Gammaproteobacteria bacterium]|nr:type II secretion system inner membrane protein GspF [Gammaproteobacteria bacterium]
MAAYEYVALDDAGRQKKGVLEADSGRQIRQLLRDQGLMPLSVEAAAEHATKAGGRNTQWFRRGMSALDQALFTRQLATLIAAGLPVEESLKAVAQQTEKRHVSALVMGIRGRVLEGRSLASSLADFPSTFSDLYRSTVTAGEQSGHLDRVLSNLADYTERLYESRRNVEMAMFYPVLLFLLAVGIVGALLVYVVPDIVKVFDNTGQELPWLTAALIGASEFVRGYAWFLLAAAAAAVFFVRWLFKQPDFRLSWDHRQLHLPLVKRFTRASNSARYAATLSILTQSGVPLVDAMNIAGHVVSNRWLRRRLTEATQRVSEGASLRSALEGAGSFPPMLIHMVASGEASGELDNMLAKVADYQQKELERMVTTLVRMFEPIMLLLMGGLVMLIVLAILLPILSMNELVV